MSPADRTKFTVKQLVRSPLFLAGVSIALLGCSVMPKTEAQTQAPKAAAQRGERATPVDAAIAQVGSLREEREYTGTTLPTRIVSVRSQAEGQLLELTADVGDRVVKGSILARLDDRILMTAVTQAEAELASRLSEVARAETQVASARTDVEQARIEWQQAESDAARLLSLAREGAISEQQAEQAQTKARTAEQAVRSAEVQVRTEKQAVAAAQARVDAQRAVIEQARERRSYAIVTAPITGTVVEKVTEPGNLVQPGGEILKIGDFSSVKVMVQISELELSQVRVGQFVPVRLDAFPEQRFEGEVIRISPQADPTARLVPVELSVSNLDGQISSGLLARVKFAPPGSDRTIVPQTALEAAGRQGGENKGKEARAEGTVFVITGEGKEAKVAARAVTLGDRANGQVEILSGLNAGERYVVRSGKPLKDGDAVRLSVLSEKSR